MRDTFVKTLIELARQDKSIELVTGDLGFGVLKPFWEQLPDQFTNAGIAEQNMTAMAAGMAMEGKNVFVYSIGNFPTLRCLEQIRNDCAYHKANVKIVCCGGGFAYGALGMSHQATEDIAIMRALPNVMVMAPGDAAEAEACTKAVADYRGTAYLRLGRGGEKTIPGEIVDFQTGKARCVYEGERVALFSTGGIFDEVQSACEMLTKKGLRPALYTFPTVKPVDRELIEVVGRDFELIATCEEHNIIGGFGSAVAEVLVGMKHRKAYLVPFGLKDVFAVKVGDQRYLRKQYGMDGASIADRVMRELNG